MSRQARDARGEAREQEGLVRLLAAGCARLRLDVAPSHLARMVSYLERVLEANRKVNLTSITEPAEAVELHLLDSLTALPLLPAGAGRLEVVDIGTGAGFPGVPLALARPERLFVWLVDAQARRVRFVEGALAELGVDNARAVHGRAEELGRGLLRERLDAAVARAVASLPVVAEYALPLLRVGGRFIAYRGREGEVEAEQAASALAELGGAVVDVRRVVLPWSGAERTLVAIDKVAGTPARYPRRPGVPERRPLG